MAYLFNSGLPTEVYVSRCSSGWFRDASNINNRLNYAWPTERLVPLDIGPFIRDYVADNTKSEVAIFDTIYHGNKFRFFFSQQNDVISVKFGTASSGSVLISVPITGISSSFPVYFFWGLSNNYSYNMYNLFLIYDKNIKKASASPVEYTPGTTYLIGEYNDDTLVDDIPTNSFVTPASVNGPTFTDTAEYYNRAPHFGFKCNMNSGSDYHLEKVTSDPDLFTNYLISADGEDPEPVDPPEPVPPEPTDPNDEGEPSDEDGGDGDHDQTYDPIPLPTKPTQGAATAGFVTLYKLSQGVMSQFASDCFASNLWEAMKLFFSNPMDFLVGVNLLPFEPTGGASWKPKFGAISFAHAYPTVANQYVDIDCGSVNITKYWGSCFDFEPYTKIQIWLPYIGYKDLPVDEIMGMTVSVKYRCDCLTGDCVAFVFTGVTGQTGPQVERIIAQFYGNCAVRVPFSSVSYDSAISNSISLIGAAASAGIAAGAGVAEAAGQAGGEISGLEAAGRELATNTSSVGMVQGMKPNIHKGGAAGASTGYMSVQIPYLIRRIPRQNLPADYMKLKGYPSNIGGKLADFTGLAVVDDIQLNDIPAMEDERKEIIQWLRGGVLI